jgi:hypothetical protein
VSSATAAPAARESGLCAVLRVEADGTDAGAVIGEEVFGLVFSDELRDQIEGLCPGAERISLLGTIELGA